MRLMGNANWWVPSRLCSFAESGAFSEDELEAEPVA
jgi:hypothetical protein